MVVQRKDKTEKRKKFEKMTLHPVKFEDAVKDLLKVKKPLRENNDNKNS